MTGMGNNVFLFFVCTTLLQQQAVGWQHSSRLDRIREKLAAIKHAKTAQLHRLSRVSPVARRQPRGGWIARQTVQEPWYTTSDTVRRTTDESYSDGTRWRLFKELTARLGNKLFQYASTVGLAASHGMEQIVLNLFALSRLFTIGTEKIGLVSRTYGSVGWLWA